MPFGRSYRRPSDKVEHEIASILQSHNGSRSRLGEGQHFGDKDCLMGDLEQTLKDVLASEPVFDKICKAAKERYPFTQLDIIADKGIELGVITEQEAELLKRTEAGRLRTINVDDFDPKELIANTQATKAKRRTKSTEAA